MTSPEGQPPRSLAPLQPYTVLLHEWMHILEEGNPRLARDFASWLNRRAAASGGERAGEVTPSEQMRTLLEGFGALIEECLDDNDFVSTDRDKKIARANALLKQRAALSSAPHQNGQETP